MNISIDGFLFGLLLSIMIGPVFFALIQNSIQKGFVAGAIMAAGIMLSDVAYIALCYFSLSPFLSHPNFPLILGFSGGAIMLGFGLWSLFKPISSPSPKPIELGKSLFIKQISKGFFLNGINPFVLFFWIGMLSYTSVEKAYDPSQKLHFFAVLMATVFSIDLCKAYLAGKLRSFITPHFIRLMNRIVGIILLLFGCRLIWYAWVEYGA